MVDPKKDSLERYLALLAYRRLELDALIDTHTHADHATGSFELRRLLGIRLIMHRRAPAPLVDEHVENGDTISIGELELKVLHTPGHTPDSISLYVGDRVLTGDVLLIRGTGRADFAGGDAGQQYDAITKKLYSLPDETLVFPGHDYRGNTQSTIGEEKQHNPRLAGRTREQYVELMNSIEFPLPNKIQEVLQPNQTAIEDDRTAFPGFAELNEVRQLEPDEVNVRLRGSQPPLLLDVREPEEYAGELGRTHSGQPPRAAAQIDPAGGRARVLQGGTDRGGLPGRCAQHHGRRHPDRDGVPAGLEPQGRHARLERQETAGRTITGPKSLSRARQLGVDPRLFNP